jgi:hypothetical protein
MVVVGAIAAFVLPSLASAHLERPSYWPDPAADTSVSPPAGGKVPKARSLASAVTGKGAGQVRVVCKGSDGKASLQRASRSIGQAYSKGFRLRPSQPKKKIGLARARALVKANVALARKCAYHSIQRAVFDSGNNDRVVIMPGRYKEPGSRKKPVNDPRCVPDLLQEDASGDMTPSYEYQVTCPNDQNLIYVQGRKVKGEPIQPPLEDRHGIPAQELGRCVRCNLQIEGSGAKPTDVILDAGKQYDGNGPAARPGAYAKDVILRIDRADGFVARNLLTRGAAEHGIYVEETDGYLLDRTKFFWAADYNNLTFTSDHGLYRNCDGFGAGDSVVYPGAAPETGSQATDFYPDAPRYNTTVKKCDLRGSALGYSGSMGNAVRITRNHIYGNTTGIASDTLSSAGHPGFPADSSKIDHNYIYSNNLDLYSPDPPVHPIVTVPIGTGIVYPGMNDAKVHDNWIFDNWRDGASLFAIPDALVSGGGPEGDVDPGISCATAAVGISTSCGNQYFDNKMGQAPPGFRFPQALDQFDVAHGSLAGGVPNGNDFWWDEFATNTGNCWYENTGADGSPGSVTGPGAGLIPDLLPADCGASLGLGDVVKEAILLDCSNGPDEDTGPLDCPWWQLPPEPASAAARREQAEFARAARRFEASDEAERLSERLEQLGAVVDG